MTDSWKQSLRLALIVTCVLVLAIVALAWLTRGDAEKSMFFYDAR